MLGKRPVVLNSRSMVVHLPGIKEGRAKCPFKFAASSVPVEVTEVCPDKLQGCAKCAHCWGRISPSFDLPDWQGDEESVDSEGEKVPPTAPPSRLVQPRVIEQLDNIRAVPTSPGTRCVCVVVPQGNPYVTAAHSR